MEDACTNHCVTNTPQFLYFISAHDPEEIEWSGVARQVATVLTSYLRYLENKVSKHDVVTRVSDPLHEVLELLQRISG